MAPYLGESGPRKKTSGSSNRAIQIDIFTRSKQFLYICQHGAPTGRTDGPFQTFPRRRMLRVVGSRRLENRGAARWQVGDGSATGPGSHGQEHVDLGPCAE